LDSLWRVWESNTENDSIREEVMSSIVTCVYESEDLDSNYIFKRKTVRLNNKERLEWKADIYQLFGAIAFDNLDYDLAEYYQKTAVNYFKRIKDPDKIANSLCSLAEYSIAQHKQEIATECIGEALMLYESTNNILGQSDCYQKLALIAWQIKDLDNSLDFSKKAYQLLKGTSHTKELAAAMNELGYNYQEIDLYKIARRYYQRSLKISRENGYLDVEANCLRNIGEIFQNLKEYTKARDYFEQSLKIKEKNNGRDKGGWITV
jgi:tetratricopeptide (TPR) repeat protein